MQRYKVFVIFQVQYSHPKKWPIGDKCVTSSLGCDAIQLSQESKQLPCQIAAGNKWISQFSIFSRKGRRLKVKPWKLENLNISNFHTVLLRKPNLIYISLWTIYTSEWERKQSRTLVLWIVGSVLDMPPALRGHGRLYRFMILGNNVPTLQ